MAVPLKYNLRNLRVRWISTVLTIFGIAAVTFIFCMLGALSQGLETTFVATGDPMNLLVLRSGASSETQSSVPKTQLELIETLEGIKSDAKGKMISAEFLVVVNHPKKDGGKANVAVRGVGPRAFELREGIQVDRMFRERTAEAVVGRALIDRFQGLAVGGKLRIKGGEVTIVGILDAAGQAYESEVWMDVEFLRQAYKQEYSSVVLRAENEGAAKALSGKLRDDPNLGFKVMEHRKYYQEQAMGAQMIQGMGMFLTIILGVGAVFGAMNTMYAAVASRVREVATMRVLGFSPFSIRVSFLFEALVIAILGGAIGAAASLSVHDLSTGTANWATFAEIAFKFRVTPGIMISGVILALLIGVFGGLFPAVRAARIPIARALREL